jgi:hypothetical protein
MPTNSGKLAGTGRGGCDGAHPFFCQLPYLADGRTDPLAQTIMTTYISRLMHEKYANVYQKIVNSLRNMIKANPQSPTLVNFMTLVRWVDAEAARRLNGDLAASGAA